MMKWYNCSQILPLGTYLSLRLHFLLSSVIRSCASRMHITKQNLKFKMRALWKDPTPIFLPLSIRRHLLLLRTILLSPSTHAWARPIGLLVHRRPDAVTHTDASLVGLGGLSLQLQFMWRCRCDTFALPGAKPLHINILELMAYIINIYFVLLRLRSPTPWTMCATDHAIGFLLHALIDNTSALGWIRHGVRSTHPQVRKLCKFLLLLIFEANSSFPFHVQPFHIAGKLNTHADAISRPQDYPAWRDLLLAFPELKQIPLFRLPSKLVSLLKWCLGSPPTEEMLRQPISSLLKTELATLSLGATP